MRRVYTTVSVLLLFVAGCGSNSNPIGPSGSACPTLSNGSMGALVNGVNWCAAYLQAFSGSFIQVRGYDSNPDAPNASQGIIQAVTVGAAGVGPGTYSTGGVFMTTHLGVVSIWNADASSVGASSTLTINTLTATGASGTFSFVAVANQTTPATGTKTVTNGVFNVTF